MQFYVPQFIDVEDKIFGPLTFKQFIYLLGGAGACAVIWFLLPNFIAIILIAPVAAFSIALAFYRVNNKPFIHVVEAAARYITNARLYIWKQRPKHVDPEDLANSPADPLAPTLSGSKLKEMSWNLDVQDSIYSQVEGGTQNARRESVPITSTQNEPEGPSATEQIDQAFSGNQPTNNNEGSFAEEALGLKSVGPRKTGPDPDL